MSHAAFSLHHSLYIQFTVSYKIIICKIQNKVASKLLMLSKNNLFGQFCNAKMYVSAILVVTLNKF